MPEDAAILADAPRAPGAPSGGAALAAAAGALVVWLAPVVLGAFAVNVLTRSMLYATLAVTVDLLWGFTGILTFGQARVLRRRRLRRRR